MISVKPRFKYIDRKKNDLLVLVPGWASDWQIFRHLDLEFNYLLPLKFSPFSFEQSLLETLRENSFKKISLFGWSLGGFLAAEFASKYPIYIDRLILVSIRKQYQKQQLKQIRIFLEKNKKAYLYKFYTQCFSKRENYPWFKQNLLESYCQQLDLDYLLGGLDYLEHAQINPALLNTVKKIQIIHGEDDAVAPIQEVTQLKGNLPQAKFTAIKETGHMPFLKENFGRYL